ncbi:MT12B-like protein, partial [Mya arenaria]
MFTNFTETYLVLVQDMFYSFFKTFTSFAFVSTEFGLGLFNLASIVTDGHYFTTKRALAVGIASCGTGIGTFAVAPLSEYLISNYGWKGAMWIIAGILRPLERQKPRVQADSESDIENECKRKSKSNKKALYLKAKSVAFCIYIDFELLKSPTMLLLCAGSFICVLGVYIPFTYLPDHARDLLFTPQQGTMLIAIIGISNTVFRVLAGWVADRNWSNPNLTKAVILFIGGAGTVGVPWYPAYGIMAGYYTIYGICIAVYVTYHSIIISNLLGMEKLES